MYKGEKIALIGSNGAGKTRLSVKIEEVNDQISELEADLEAPFDDEYIEKVAHDKLGMRYPQEIIYYSGEGEN